MGWASPIAPVGQLLFTAADGSSHSCSATVVGRSYILTAAHCVYTEAGLPDAAGWHRNFAFFPQKNGSRSAGAWTADYPYATTFTDYQTSAPTNEPAFVLDYALVKIVPQAGYEIGDWTGTFGVLFNGAGLDRRFAIGYPTDLWWSDPANGGGQYAWYCDASGGGLTSQTFPDGHSVMWTGCNAAGGFSGGPQFEYWNGAWYVAGVNSRMNSNFANHGIYWSNASVSEITGPDFNALVKTIVGG